MIKKWLPAALLMLSLTFIADRAVGSTELTGILTQIDGAVQLAGPGVNGLPLASLWQVIRARVTVRVPTGSAVGIVCSTRHFVRLQGPASWSLTEQSCIAGKELTPGEYALVAPQAGRFKVVNGLQTLEREMRGGDGTDRLAPVVLNPRNTILLSLSPTVSWIRVQSAVEYEVEWRGGGIRDYDTRLKAEDAGCAAGPEGFDVCSLSWPMDRPDLPPGENFLLRLAARQGDTEPWHWTDPVEVHTQTIAGAASLEGRLHDLKDLGLEGGALEAARAGLLAKGGFYADAAEGYRRALASSPSAELNVTLADIYLATGLHNLAEVRYGEALKNNVPGIRAAAAFGFGRIEYARGRYQDAANYFRQAGDLYADLRLKAEEAAARRAAEESSARAQK